MDEPGRELVHPSPNGRRSTAAPFRSVKELNAKLRGYIDDWNDRAHPFTWTRTADEILKKATRKKAGEQ